MRHDYTTRLIQVCLEIANLADEKGEQGEFILPEIGLGYRALSRILRRGCKDIIDLQGKYHAAIEGKILAKIGEKTAYDFLEDIFGDREIDSINDKDKDRIKAFVKQIYDEWIFDEAAEGSENENRKQHFTQT